MSHFVIECGTEYKEILKNNQKDRILNSSEYLWKLSNIVVNKIEIKTHNHIALQYLFLFLLFAIVCILGLVGFFIRKVVQENIEKKASHDQLTNLLNRNYLHQITAVRFNMTNPPKKVVKYQEAAVNSLDSKFL